VSEAIKGVPHELKMKIVGTEDFDALKPLEINARAAYDINPLKKAEWDEVVRISPVPRHPVSSSHVALAFDGQLDEWDSLRYGFGPAEGQDGAACFDVRFDEEFLYVGYLVSDDEVTQVAPQGFDGTADLVYLMIDARPSELSGMQLGSTEAMKKGEWIFLAVAPHAEEGQIAYADLMPKGFAGQAQRTQTGFTAELRVPVAYLNHVYCSEWQDFRINASYLDADPQGAKVRNYDWQPKREQNVVGTGLFFREDY
jgi:hypothetical protein